MLAEASKRGVKIAATEAKPAAGEAKQDAERGCRDYVRGSNGPRCGRSRGGAAAVLRGPGEGVKAEGDIGEIRPGVGAGTEEILAVDTLGVVTPAQVATPGAGIPDVAAGVGLIEGDESEDEGKQSTPNVEVKTQGKAEVR